MEMASVWNELRTTGQFVDATIMCKDGVTYPVHKIILSSHSQFFKAIFSSPSCEESRNNTVTLSNVDSSTLEPILDYMYQGKLIITPQTVTPLLHAADYLRVLRVHEECVTFLRNSLKPSNCISIRKFARDHFLQSLQQAAEAYLLRNFPQVAKESLEILTLSLDDLVPILSSDLLNVHKEDMVWKFVLRWVDHDKDNRLLHLNELLKCIRLGLMEAKFFLEQVKGHPYVVDNPSSKPVIINTMKVLLDVETITQKDGVVRTPECAMPRIPHEVMFAIGGWSGGNSTNAIESYDSRADRWINVSEVDAFGPRAYHGTAVIGHDIYLIGGFNGTEHFSTCQAFNAATKTWRTVAPMHERRCYVSVAVIDDVIYTMGGYNGHHRQNTVEKYDSRTNQWAMVAPMHVQRSDASATGLDGKVYITGGFDGLECLSSAEVYDPQNNVWTLLPPMSVRRSGVSCIAYHNSIYVLGGFNGLARMAMAEKYSPQTNSWTPLPEMYTTRSNFGIEVIDDMVFAVGGFNGVATIHQVECYDESTNEWYEASDMNVFRSALSTCVVADLPNISDYIHHNRHMLMEEKRQKLLAQQKLHDVNNILESNFTIMQISQAMQEVADGMIVETDQE